MVTIQRLTAKGFKSFAKKTELVFGGGFNCILGPNGSGKSNVCDALCFVLGKSSAKGLRAEKSANLIYNGGKKGTPAKEAEVTIEFQDKTNEFNLNKETITLTRKVRNNGTSKYYINEEQHTRQQVVDLLKKAKIDPDGHNIILQGDIVQFMEMKTVQRREIIEDIAGISIYEEKKDKCLRELDKVSTKLNEVQIILTEREANLRELKKDRDQALKYKEAQKNIKDFKATALTHQIKAKTQKEEEYDKRLTDQQKRVDKIEEKIIATKEKINKLKDQVAEINTEVEKKGEKEQILLRQQIDELKELIIKMQSRADVVTTELERIKNRKKQLQEDQKEINKKITDAKKQKESLKKNAVNAQGNLEKVNAELKKIKQDHGIADSSAADAFEQLEQEIEALQRKVEEKRQELQEQFRQKDHASYQLENVTKRIQGLKGLGSSEEVTKLKEKRARLQQIEKELQKAKAQDQVLSTQIIRLKQSAAQIEEELAKAYTRQARMQEQLTGNAAVQKILNSKMQGIFGTVAQLGQVDKEYALALEIAAGARLQSVVVESDLVAQKCIGYLKQNRLGVVTFIPLNKIKERVIPEEIKRLAKSNKVHGLALDLVQYDRKFKKVFSYVFGPTVIVDDINQARRIGIGLTRMVTLEGDVLEISGAMVGGFRNKKNRGTGFIQKGLDKEVQNAEAKQRETDKQLQQVLKQRNANDETILNLRQEKASLDGEVITLEKTLNLDGIDLSALEQEQAEHKESLASIQLTIKQGQKETIEWAKAIDDLKLRRQKVKQKLANPQVSKLLEQTEAKKAQFREEMIKSEASQKNIDAQISNLLTPELEKIEQIFKQQGKDAEEFKNELNSLKEILKERQKELAAKEKHEQKFFANIKDLINKRNKCQEKIQAQEANIIRDEEAARSVEHKMNNLAVDRAKTVAEKEGLQKELELYPEATIKRGLDIDEIKVRIREYERIIAKIGNVNLRALEVYDELKAEHEKLQEKAEVISAEKEDVLNMIAEVETNKKDLFMKTYNVIVKNFKRIFAELNSKGEAMVILEDPEDPFAGGVEIQIKLARNKIMDIKSLSGGEKTMAALAFIFAIQEYEPSSFYFLDEIDAALDKKNSEMLSQLVRKYAGAAQYIVISHNDTVISEADQIYGVSMQDGMSKIVSLKV